MNIENFNKRRDELVKEICDYCISQAELWKVLPYWALQAEGRSGWSEQYSRCYERGMWQISGYHIDCKTGKLMWNNYHVREEYKSHYTLLEFDLDNFTAQPILDDLKQHVIAHTGDKDHSVTFNKYPSNWRDVKYQELNLPVDNDALLFKLKYA